MAEKWQEYQEHARSLSDEELADFLSLDDLRAFRDEETGERLISSSDFLKAGYFPGARTDAAVPFRVQEYEERQKSAENPSESDLRRHYYQKLNEKYGKIIAEYPPRPSPHGTWNTAISDMLKKGLETSKSSDVVFKNLGGSVYTENIRERGSNMPNVAGVQFPYTPQGVQAAQLYQRSLSPRRGLGFRPIRMDNGGSAEAKAIAQGLYALMSDGTNEEVQAYVNKNRKDLEEIAKIDDRMFDMLRRVLYGDEAVGVGGSQIMEEGALGAAAGTGAALAATGLGRREALRAAGDTRPSDQDSSLGPVFHGDFTDEEKGYWNRAREARRAREQAGTGLPPYLGVPPSSEQFDDTTAIFNKRIEPLRRLERRPERPPEPWEFGGLGVDSPTPQGMAHGGVPRGTVAGELEPRGYLTARQAGETMRERAKGLRDPRRYGGIGSLYNRYG